MPGKTGYNRENNTVNAIMVNKSAIFLALLGALGASRGHAFEEQDLSPFSATVPAPVEIREAPPISEVPLGTQEITSPSDPYGWPQQSFENSRAPVSIVPQRFSVSVAMNHNGLGTYARATYEWNEYLRLIPDVLYRGGYQHDDFFSDTGPNLNLGANLQILRNFALYGEVGAGYHFWQHRWEDPGRREDRGHGLVGIAKAAIVSKLTKNFSFIFQRLWMTPVTDSGRRFFAKSHPPKFEALFEYAI
jgi:hypothetical protein